jgi:hypothetical protein
MLSPLSDSRLLHLLRDREKPPSSKDNFDASFVSHTYFLFIIINFFTLPIVLSRMYSSYPEKS